MIYIKYQLITAFKLKSTFYNIKESTNTSIYAYEQFHIKLAILFFRTFRVLSKTIRSSQASGELLSGYSKESQSSPRNVKARSFQVSEVWRFYDIFRSLDNKELTQ